MEGVWPALETLWRIGLGAAGTAVATAVLYEFWRFWIWFSWHNEFNVAMPGEPPSSLTVARAFVRWLMAQARPAPLALYRTARTILPRLTFRG